VWRLDNALNISCADKSFATGWMPLFVYQCPIALLVAIILGIIGLLVEGWNDSDVGEASGLFTWLSKGPSTLQSVLL
jgi:hypothetical protein